LDLAINSLSEPLTAQQLQSLISLHAAHKVVAQRIGRYDDIDLRTLILLGREAEALNYARLRSSPNKQFLSLYIIYEFLVKHNRPTLSLLDELQELAYDVQEPKRQVSDLGMLAYKLIQVGQKEKAEKLFADARNIALCIENKSQQTWALKELIYPLAMSGKLAEAEEIARNLTEIQQKGWGLATVASLLANTGLSNTAQRKKVRSLFSEVQEIVVALSNKPEQQWLLKELAIALIECGELVS
jgi:hypothetical protein